jgi:hypothetical protein
LMPALAAHVGPRHITFNQILPIPRWDHFGRHVCCTRSGPDLAHSRMLAKAPTQVRIWGLTGTRQRHRRASFSFRP